LSYFFDQFSQKVADDHFISNMVGKYFHKIAKVILSWLQKMTLIGVIDC